MIGDWLFGWVYELFYILQKSICYILDFIREVFFKLAGIETVAIGGEQEELLTHFILSDGIRNAFFGVFLVGVILLFVFVLIAIVKSEAADPQHKKTKGQILVKALQSFVVFLLIPFLLVAGIMLANVIMGAIHGSMTGVMYDGNTTSLIGGQILVTSGSEAYIGPAGMREQIERMFVTGQLDYNNLSVVKQYYDLGDINFFVGIAGGLVILIMFVMSAVMFVQRIFDIILLYIVSPASVATIPLDEGGRFRIWREMLVSKVLGAYGIILSMNIFFLIIPQVSTISFFGDTFKDGIIQLLFILGGAFSITKANMIIAQLTGTNAGMQEMQQMMSNVHSGMHMVRSAGHLAAGAAGMIIGGTDFLSNRKHGASLSENLSATVHSQRNQHFFEEDSGNDPDGGGSGAGSDKPTDENQTNVADTARQTETQNGGSGTATDNNTATASENATAGLNAQTDATVTEAASADVKAAESQDEPQTAAKPQTEQNDVAQAAKNSGITFGSVVKGTTRLSTLPAGVLKDFIQGGVIVAGKNFGARVRNVLKGNTVINRADVKKPVVKAAKSALKENKDK